MYNLFNDGSAMDWLFFCLCTFEFASGLCSKLKAWITANSFELGSKHKFRSNNSTKWLKNVAAVFNKRGLIYILYPGSYRIWSVVYFLEHGWDAPMFEMVSNAHRHVINFQKRKKYSRRFSDLLWEKLAKHRSTIQIPQMRLVFLSRVFV